MRFAILAALALAACSGNGQSDSMLIVTAQDEVRARLRDPSSAEFSDMRVVRNGEAIVVCGTVNARNGFGGMSGPQRFISGAVTGLESDFAPGEFAVSWAELC